MDCSETKIFAHQVQGPRNYCVVEISPSGEIISIAEKPNNLKSKFEIQNLYL